MDNSYDCSETVFPQTDNTPLGTGYIVQLVVDPFSSLNSTYVRPALHAIYLCLLAFPYVNAIVDGPGHLCAVAAI